MDKKKYNNELAEYFENHKKMIDNFKNTKVMAAVVADDQIAREQERVNKLLESNEEQAKMLFDLDHISHKDDQMYSLTEIAKKKNATNPSYEIQSWLRNINTLVLICLWEEEHNKEFNKDEATNLIDKTKEPSFTITAKKWIQQTNAKGITSKQGNGGGTLAHHEIAIDFICWLFPEKRYKMAKMIRKNILVDLPE